MDTSDYEQGNVKVGFLSDLSPEEGEALIGKTVKKIDASEHCVVLTFTNNSYLTLSGGRWDGCCLGAELST